MTTRSGRTAAEELGVLIKETQAVLHQRMDEALRPLGLTVPQYVCLQNLVNDRGITGSELARRTFVSRQSANVLLQGLERRGLIARSDEPGPRRERAIALTAEATSLVDAARARVAVVAERLSAPLGDARLRALCTDLATARDALLDAG